jgi:hypothetical protein
MWPQKNLDGGCIVLEGVKHRAIIYHTHELPNSPNIKMNGKQIITIHGKLDFTNDNHGPIIEKSTDQIGIP